MSNTKIMLNVHVSACGAPDVKLFEVFITNHIQNSESGPVILEQVTIYPGLWIGRDGHLDQSEACDIS